MGFWDPDSPKHSMQPPVLPWRGCGASAYCPSYRKGWTDGRCSHAPASASAVSPIEDPGRDCPTWHVDQRID